jgi:hypothetical protein
MQRCNFFFSEKVFRIRTAVYAVKATSVVGCAGVNLTVRAMKAGAD